MDNQPFVIPATIIFLISIPLIIGWIPRNRYYGIRTGKTLADDASWYPANRFGGWALILASLIYLGMAALFPYVASSRDNLSTWWLHLTAFVVPLVAGLGLTCRYIRKL